ncbi:16S rRNA (adenine(1518)-N(6)/adenine(1519)-N(6))-dimethyltransferase RsmA [Patescibacteria group bacterium]
MKKSEILELLNKYNMRPKKSLGQNFLMDANVVQKIVQAANATKQDCIIEIGPGLGILTKELAKTGAGVVSVELDSGAIPLLESELKNYSNVKIINEDALKFSPPSGKYKVVANIPYYITSPLISHFLKNKNRPTKMVILIQKEVAEKICAKEGKLSVLAINVLIFGKPKIVTKVSRGCFHPVPKVESAVLEIDMFDKPLVEEENLEKFFKIVHAGFAHKRKTLLNSFIRSIDIDVDTAREAIEKSGVSPTARAQHLSIDDWKRLSNNIL